jgi:hypothetical protein
MPESEFSGYLSHDNQDFEIVKVILITDLTIFASKSAH